jgi:hypothetical protein
MPIRLTPLKSISRHFAWLQQNASSQAHGAHPTSSLLRGLHADNENTKNHPLLDRPCKFLLYRTDCNCPKTLHSFSSPIELVECVNRISMASCVGMHSLPSSHQIFEIGFFFRSGHLQHGQIVRSGRPLASKLGDQSSDVGMKHSWRKGAGARLAAFIASRDLVMPKIMLAQEQRVK